MDKITFEDNLILGAIKTVRRLIRPLSYRACMGIGAFFGDFAYIFSKRQSVMKRNLRAVFAGQKNERELKQIARASFHNLARAGIDLLRAPEMDSEFINKHIHVIGREKLDAALKRGKGVILLTAHFGSWELLNICGSILGYPMVALARVQKHRHSDTYLNDLRRCKGTDVIYKGMPVREILRTLKQGRIVGILSDQDGGRGGSFVPFFGRMSSYPKGVATFALRTGAAVFPVFIFREGLVNHRVEIEGPLDFPHENLTEDQKESAILEQFAKALESKVLKDPCQWLWAHRRWKSTPDRFVAVLSDGKAGHRNQSMALYEAIVRQRLTKGACKENTHLKVIEVEFKNDLSRAAHRILYRVFGAHLPAAGLWAKKFLKPGCYEEIMKTYADVVISAGSSVAGVNLWCAGLNEARPVVIMNPGFGLKAFHAVVVPKHDRLPKRPNIFETRGALSRDSSEKMAQQALVLQSEIGPGDGIKRIGFLVGGDTKQMFFEPKIFATLAGEVSQTASKRGCQVLATTSRRTPSWADRLMKELFDNPKICPFLVVANEKNRPDAVPAILGVSDVLVVTGESISMVSEAIASGKKVFIIEPFGGRCVKRKHKDFLKLMENDGMIERIQPGKLACRLEDELFVTTRPAKIDATGEQETLRRIAEKINP